MLLHISILRSNGIMAKDNLEHSSSRLARIRLRSSEQVVGPGVRRRGTLGMAFCSLTISCLFCASTGGNAKQRTTPSSTSHAFATVGDRLNAAKSTTLGQIPAKRLKFGC